MAKGALHTMNVENEKKTREEKKKKKQPAVTPSPAEKLDTVFGT